MTFKMHRFIWTLIGILVFSDYCFADQWVNPKELIGDPTIARLQQGRKELYDYEKEDIKKYGYTGLELMTYMDVNKDAGKDSEAYFRTTTLDSSGIIKTSMLIRRWKFYKDYKARLTLDGIKPGDVVYHRSGFSLYPSDNKGSTFMNEGYLNSKDIYKLDKGWNKQASLRRVRRGTGQQKQDDFFGQNVSHDDWHYREPWEENHIILGEDTIRGKDCFVVESKMWYVKDYYLSKRVIWIEKENFLDLHEEQLDKGGRIYRILDKEWVHVKPWNYWARASWFSRDLKAKSMVIEHSWDWKFNQGFDKKNFSMRMLQEERSWRSDPENPPPAIEKVSEFSPIPEVRMEFWQKIGQKPAVSGD